MIQNRMYFNSSECLYEKIRLYNHILRNHGIISGSVYSDTHLELDGFIKLGIYKCQSA